MESSITTRITRQVVRREVEVEVPSSVTLHCSLAEFATLFITYYRHCAGDNIARTGLSEGLYSALSALPRELREEIRKRQSSYQNGSESDAGLEAVEAWEQTF